MKSGRILTIPRHSSGWRTILFMAGCVMLWAAQFAMAGPVGTAFTYQGRLIDANEAADGLYDFQFKLFDANVAGTQKGSTNTIADLDVIDGHFTVELDFGSVFDGNERWFDIGVRPGEMEDPNVYTALSPRQEITPTPYALYAKTAGGGVGADSDWIISGNNMYSGVSGNVGIGTTNPTEKLEVVDGTIKATNSLGNGGCFESAGADACAVYGVATNTGDYNNYGGYFEAAGSIGKGVYGNASNSGSSYNYGGYFEAAGRYGKGVECIAGNSGDYTNFGGIFYARGAYGQGVRGVASNSGNYENYGGNFAANGSSGRGVYGYAVHSSGTNYGVYGQTNSPNGYAGYFKGGRNYFEGNVGIGTTSPTAKLDVAGHINSDESYKLDGSTVLANTGNQNIFVGQNTGVSNTTGYYNTFSGYGAGQYNTTGAYNTFSGNGAGYYNTEGSNNTFSGYCAGFSNTTGYYNTFSGNYAGRYNTTGAYNTFLGNYAGYANTGGSYNTLSGYCAGYSNQTGSGNVFLGYLAGYNETGSNKLYIANSSANPPLIYGDFSSGNVGIGTTSPAAKLDVQNTVDDPYGLCDIKAQAGIINYTFGGYGIRVMNSENRLYPDSYAPVYGGYFSTVGPPSYNCPEHHCTSSYSVFSEVLYNENGFTDISYAVYGKNNVGGSIGALGCHDSYGGGPGNAGVYGSSNGCGVYGKSNNTSGYAGYFVGGKNYFEGNVGINTTTPARNLHINDVMRLQPRATAPSTPAEGDIYMNSSTHKLMVYDGSAWQACW